MLDKLKQRIAEAKDNAVRHAQAVSEAIRVSDNVQAERMSICKGCEHLFEPTNSCKKCGCFMSVKTWMAPARCPVGKWEALKISEHGSNH